MYLYPKIVLSSAPLGSSLPRRKRRAGTCTGICTRKHLTNQILATVRTFKGGRDQEQSILPITLGECLFTYCLFSSTEYHNVGHNSLCALLAMRTETGRKRIQTQYNVNFVKAQESPRRALCILLLACWKASDQKGIPIHSRQYGMDKWSSSNKCMALHVVQSTQKISYFKKYTYT